MAAVTENSCQSCHPNFLQALPLLNGLCFCLDSGFWQIEAECEDSLLVSLLSEDGSIYSEIGLLVGEIEEIILKFQFFSISHIVKSCNSLTRALTIDALAKEGPLVCFEECPPCLQYLVHNDLQY